MKFTSTSQILIKFARRALTGSRLIVLLMLAMTASVVPARAQSADTWKSIAIIGGSTAAGAYIGHKVGGTTGAYVGAAVGATAGYAIDRRRRQNAEYNNGYYGDDGGYYGDDYPYDRNDGYYSDGGYGNNRDGYPYSCGSQNDPNCANHRRRR
jgi:hypothetical protein